MIEALVLAGVSTLLYHLGMGFVFFLIPLQVVLIRKGSRSFALTAGLAFALIIAVRFILLAGNQGSLAAPFLVMEIATVVLLLGGLIVIQLPEIAAEFERFRAPRVLRLLIATAITGLLAVPLILYLRGSEEFTLGLQQLFESLSATMNSALSASETFGFVPGNGLFQAETLMEVSRTLLLRSFLFDYFLLLTFSWWLGTIIGFRTLGKSPGMSRVANFKLPDVYIWPLIASLAVVLGSLFVRLGFLEIVAWNVLLIMAFLYGVAGLGIIRFLLKKFKIPAGLRWLLILIIIFAAFTPRISLAVLVLVPGLGVSEIWLKYRREERSKA